MQLPDTFSPFKEKNVVFCLVVGGVTPPYTLNGPTTKKITFFMCVFPKGRASTTKKLDFFINEGGRPLVRYESRLFQQIFEKILQCH